MMEGASFQTIFSGLMNLPQQMLMLRESLPLHVEPAHTISLYTLCLYFPELEHFAFSVSTSLGALNSKGTMTSSLRHPIRKKSTNCPSSTWPWIVAMIGNLQGVAVKQNLASTPSGIHYSLTINLLPHCVPFQTNMVYHT